MSPELEQARAREETFQVSVTKKSPSFSHRSSEKKQKSTHFKKALPLLAIFLVTGIFGVMAFFIQSFLPIALVTRFREEYNATGVSALLRSDIILELQMEHPDSFYALSEVQRDALELNGITPLDIESPSRATVFAYESSKNKYSIVAPASLVSSASTVASAVASVYTPPAGLSFSGDVLSLEEAYSTPSFKNPYTVASKQWRGGSAGWYDTYENLNEARLSISRTRYASFASQILNSGTKEIWQKLASGSVTVADSGITDYSTFLDTDADGNETVSTSSGTLDSSSLSSASTPEQVYNILNSKIASVLKVVGTAGCAGVEIANSISTVVEAQQTFQYLNFATGVNEAFDGQKAGLEGYGEAAQEYLDALTTRDPETGQTPMEAPGIMDAFTGSGVSPDDPSLAVTNFENLLTRVGSLSSHIAFTAEAFKACSYIKLAVSGANFATTVLSFVPVIGQATSVIHIATRTIARLAIGVAVGSVASFLIPKILDSVVTNLTKNVVTEWFGIAQGNAYAAGTNRQVSSNFQIGGGSPASEDNYLSYHREVQIALEQEAATDRALRSPLDITSPHTFLGSLAYAAVPLATSSGAPSILKNLASLARTSLTALLPSASAVAETDLIRSRGNCPYAESVGAVGDAVQCNVYYAEDTSTLHESPEAVIDRVAALNPDNFKHINPNGTQEINPDSPLGYYTKFCGTRNTPHGRADGSIANELVQTPSSLISNSPLVGDLSQIASAMSELKNAPWISGSACVFSSENDQWEEMKWYQRYLSDQRLAENSGLLAVSAPSALLAEYYAEHPLDNSPVGIIARYSGLSKPDVVATLDFLDGLTLIASYDASSRSFFASPSSSSRHTAQLAFASPDALPAPSAKDSALKLATAYAKISIRCKKKVPLEIFQRPLATVV